MAISASLTPPKFLSTLSLRRATRRLHAGKHRERISIHALLAESDLADLYAKLSTVEFLSTLSLRRATPGARRGSVRADISIHALLAESDASTRPSVCGAGNFYPRSPCGERRCGQATVGTPARFLSTLSLRRATWEAMSCLPPHPYFYPRSPCGERRVGSGSGSGSGSDFYPRSPCGERRRVARRKADRAKFLSTLSLRRATVSQCGL